MRNGSLVPFARLGVNEPVEAMSSDGSVSGKYLMCVVPFREILVETGGSESDSTDVLPKGERKLMPIFRAGGGF